jgi:hypothetical protein
MNIFAIGCSAQNIGAPNGSDAEGLSGSDQAGGLLSCLAAVGTTVASGKLNSSVAKAVCFAALSETGPIDAFVCGTVVGNLTSKLGPAQLKNAVCATVEDNICSQAACDPIKLGWRLLGLNGHFYSQTCAHSTVAQWVDLKNGQIVGSGAERCANAPDRSDPNGCQGGRGPSRPCF